MNDATLCPCGTGRALADCCGPYLEGTTHAPTAEALMRSRYSAHVLANLPYIVATHDEKTRATIDTIAVEKWSKQSQWRGLVVHQTSAGGPTDTHGTVEFTATYHAMGRTVAHHERSTFERVDDRWYYVAGETPKSGPVRAAAKPGRNDPCSCGSGKKYKKCCG